MTITIITAYSATRTIANVKSLSYDGRYLTIIYKEKENTLSVQIPAIDIIEWDAL